MVVLVRLDELQEGRNLGLAHLPTVAEAAASAEWRWRLFAGLHRYLHVGDPVPLQTLSREACEPPDVAAGAVVASAALLECGRAEEAANLLEEVINRDIAVPIDHAWLQAQLARAYADLGRLIEARNLGLSVQRLRTEFPQDASATAIAGSAAQLVFTVSDFGDIDLADVIRATDSTATWWRTQVSAWGLGDEADQQFAAWTGATPTEEGLNDLRAVSLMAGFAADRGGWRNATSRVARHRLLTSTATSPADHVSGRLIMFRLSGDNHNMERATTHVMLDGPAAAVTQVGHQLDLNRSPGPPATPIWVSSRPAAT